LQCLPLLKSKILRCLTLIEAQILGKIIRKYQGYPDQNLAVT
jgi:hypothetical protein